MQNAMYETQERGARRMNVRVELLLSAKLRLRATGAVRGRISGEACEEEVQARSGVSSQKRLHFVKALSINMSEEAGLARAVTVLEVITAEMQSASFRVGAKYCRGRLRGCA